MWDILISNKTQACCCRTAPLRPPGFDTVLVRHDDYLARWRWKFAEDV